MFFVITLLLAFAFEGRIVTGHPVHPFEQINQRDKIIKLEIPSNS
ncbi:hypothetical protein Bhyg_01185, partial [Pseudolycoriella hygida]